MNLQKRWKILSVIVISVLLRVWSLGGLPEGLSIKEVELGLSLTNIFGDLSYSPFFIRLPFFLLGIFSIYLFYKVVEKMTNNENFALISALFLSFTPWHFIESRIYSLGIIVFTLSLLAIYYLLDKKKLIEKGAKILPVVVVVAFLLSIFIIPEGVATEVDRERNLAAQSGFNLSSKPFSNKLISSYRQKERLVIESLDFGNYFFLGHPRERWGTEETQKFFVSLLPLFLVGLFLIKKKNGWLLFSWTMIFIFLPGIMGERVEELKLPFVFPFIFLTAKGLFHFWNKKRKTLLYLLMAIFVFEFLYFGAAYFEGYSESRFSPRRPYYDELVRSVKEEREGGERVLVTQRIDNPETFFKFYLRDMNLDNYEFRNFQVWEEEIKDGIFVDVLPDKASPAEFLNKDGEYPDEIDVLKEVRDEANKRTIVLYRYR